MSVPYWYDFTGKYGFSDGESIPADAWLIWWQNVLVVNRCAEKMGSDTRVVRWMRDGLHNPYLILFVSKEFYDGLPKEVEEENGVLNFHIDAEVSEEAVTDDAFLAALDLAGNILDENTCVISNPVWDGNALARMFDEIGKTDVSEYLNSETEAEDEQSQTIV